MHANTHTGCHALVSVLACSLTPPHANKYYSLEKKSLYDKATPTHREITNDANFSGSAIKM